MNWDQQRYILWKHFFPHMTQTCGMNLVEDLVRLEALKLQKKNEADNLLHNKSPKQSH